MPESCISLALGLKGHRGCKGGEGGEKRKKETERNNTSHFGSTNCTIQEQVPCLTLQNKQAELLWKDLISGRASTALLKASFNPATVPCSALGQLAAQSLLMLPGGAIRNLRNNCWKWHGEWQKIYCCSFPRWMSHPVWWGIRHSWSAPLKSHLSAPCASWDCSAWSA